MSKYTYKEIVEHAKNCVNNIKNKYKNGINSNWSYYFSKGIITKKDVKKISIAEAPHPVANKFDKTVKKEDYIKSCKNYVAFVEKHETLPNFVTVCGVQISPHVWTGLTAFILANNIPKQQKFNSNVYNNPNKLHDYITTKGCSGMGQCTAYNCACNSLQQMFYRLTGIKVSESEIAKWAGTTTSGTDHQGINTAVAMFNKKYNKNVKIVWYNFKELGKNSKERWEKIKALMKKGALFFHLCYRGPNGVGHYEGIKSVGDSLKILNSLGDRCNYPAYCGYVETRERSTQEWYISGISQKSVAYLYNG